MQITKVKILKNLPAALAKERSMVNKYETHAIFKAFETFCYLKEVTTSGKIHCITSTHSLVTGLADVCNLSVNSMYNRIELLKQYKLITVTKQGHIILESWETIANTYKVKDKEFYEITVDEETKIEYKLRALVIAEHKQRMEFAFANKINSNNQLREYLVSFFGFVPKSTKEWADMILKAKILSFKNWSDSFDFWHSLPSDFNASVNKIMQHFSFKDFRQVAYWKKQLSKLGLITVQTRKIESKKATRKATNVFTGGKVLQHFFYDLKTHTRVWQLPDAITVNF